MSSKTKNKKGLQPKLRFPEFRDAGDWEPKTLGEIVQLVIEKAGDRKFTLMSITSGVGLVSQMEKFGREIAGAAYKNYFVIRKNDFAYNKSATKEYPEGYIAMYSGESEGAVPNSIFTCFRIIDSEVVPKYLDYQFAGNLHGKWLKNFLTIGARAHGSLNIDNNDLLSLPVPMPTGRLSKKEQQKIADCLSSLDELIEAEEAKLDALQQHKKGLMQELFPAEGETLPKRRFPEFKNAPEWEIKPLGKVADNLDSKRVPITEQDRIRGDVPYYGASGVIDYVQDFIFDEDLLCISEDGANLIARTYPIAFSISGRTWVNNHAHVLKFKHPSMQLIVEEYLNFICLEDYLTGMAQPKLNRAKLDIIPIPLPDNEEQKLIAECLSSINTLITSQSQKLDSLRHHKKGLMQQLFPTVSEVQDE